MAYNSLTEAPHNLKEGIDWLMAVKGTDAEKNLKAVGEAIHHLLKRHPVGLTVLPSLENVKYFSQRFMKKQEFRDLPFVKELLERYKAPMNKNPKRLPTISMGKNESDYKNVVRAWGLTAKKVADKVSRAVDACEKFLEDVKLPDQYKSAYSSEATWDASCAQDPEACAVVFVGIAPMLYAGLRSLKEASKAATAYVADPMEETRLRDVLKSAGYKEPECSERMTGSDIHKALSGVHKDVLDIIYNFAGFWAFY
ncbi:hypothetical protein, conserved [Babesia ovata]|uniref:Uncharacterized protein n=1 Tax=Babesia ovata TaxID=189622 RepID=A0A2H6K9C8_9APIC|nr:uncharacterized protein BOVATA_011050 [Babesia ovata]GBE59612.1 hypothetical protein, conserved [Babesia ovata]